MSRVFITGSADGLGLMAGQLLAGQGHDVVLHARNAARAERARARCPGAAAVLIGDVATLDAMRELAGQANALGRFDAVIHNVAVGYQEPRIDTADGLPHVFAINVLAPYVLTALMQRPGRLVYLSSGLHRGVAPDDLDQGHRTQVWLAVSDDAEARVTARYFFHRREREPAAAAHDTAQQDRLLAVCEEMTGVRLPD